MATVHFTVNNQLTQAVDENILVFLVPVNASPNFQLAAWQSLNIGTDGSQPFDYSMDIQVQVQRMDNLSTSAKVSIAPGQIFDAVVDNVGGLKLVAEDPNTGTHAGEINHDQCAVANAVEPAALIKTMWYVNGNPCVAMPDLNQNSLSIFELEASLFFRAAQPTVQGFNYTLQQVSEETRYVIPASATQVTVDWTRPGGPSGADTLTFDPPSQEIPGLLAVAAQAPKLRARPQASA
jgi:hypothetical protein